MSILEILIPEHMTIQEKYPSTTYFGDCDHSALWGNMVVTTTKGGSHAEIEQTVPILELLIPEHMTIQETNP